MTRHEPWKKPTTKKPDPTNFFASTKRCIVVSLFGLPSQGGGAGRGRGGDEIDRQLHGQAQEKIAREFLRRPSAGAGGHVLKHQGERGRGDPAEGRKEGYIYIYSRPTCTTLLRLVGALSVPFASRRPRRVPPLWITLQYQ